MAVDYRRLLWKYMNHVGECEGSTFITVAADFESDGWQNVRGIEFTAEEVAALDEVAAVERPRSMRGGCK